MRHRWTPVSQTGLLGGRREFGLLVPILIILSGYVLYPSLQTFFIGLEPDNLLRVFSSWRSANVRGLQNSVLISVYSVAGSGLLGTFLAYLFFRFDFPLKGILRAVAAVPLALPPLVGVIAFLFLYGESGILPRLLQSLLQLDSVPFSFEGLWAVWLVHVYSMYVYFYLFVSAALARLDRSVIDASQDLGASPLRTLIQVIVPITRPALTSAALLVFMISMASFTAPLLFAADEPFLTLQIFNYKTNGDLALSATVSTVLTVICLAFLILIEFGQNDRRPSASKGTAPPPVSVRGGLLRWSLLLVASGVLLFLLLPIATVFLISLVAEGSWTTQVFPTEYTTANYSALFKDPAFAEPLVNSLRMASLATLGNLAFGVAAGLVIAKGRLPGRWVLRLLSVLPFAIPGTVIAVNLIVTFNQPTGLGLGQVLVGTFWILPLAYFIRHIPLIVRATTAALDGLDDALIEASMDLGAPLWSTFMRVIRPIIAPAVIAGTLLTFIAAVGEFVSSIMLYVYSNRPISVEILSQLRLYDFGAAAAYSVFLMIIVLLTTVAVRFIAPSRGYGDAFA